VVVPFWFVLDVMVMMVMVMMVMVIVGSMGHGMSPACQCSVARSGGIVVG
jgi:hypothetical protein